MVVIRYLQERQTERELLLMDGFLVLLKLLLVHKNLESFVMNMILFVVVILIAKKIQDVEVVVAERKLN